MRNMIDVNISAFSNMIKEYRKYGNAQIEGGKRYIKTNAEEQVWIKEAQISNSDILVVTPDIRLIQLTFNKEYYIALIGIDTSELLSLEISIIEEIEINAGVISLLLSTNDLKIHKRANHLEFYNNILFQHLDGNYKGHDFEDLLPYIEPIQLFKLAKNSIINSNILDRTACYFFSINHKELILDFSNEVMEFISELSILGSDKISYSLILNCMFSTTYKHAFLELYRLVERLFPITYLKEFHSKSNTNLDFLEFTSELEKITSWRPKEEDAVEKLYSISKQNTKTCFENFHVSSAELREQNPSKFFYQLRNSIVHFRANHMEVKLDTNQWNLLLLATLYLIDDHYSVNHNILE